MKLKNVIFSYCDDGFRGITHKVVGTESKPTTIIENFFDKFADKNKLSSRLSNGTISSNQNIWETSVSVNAYTIVSKDFTSSQKLS